MSMSTTPGDKPAAAARDLAWVRKMRDAGVESIRGFRVMARDGEAGVVEQVLFWSDTRLPDYLVVGSGRWFFGHKSVLPTNMIEDIDINAKQIAMGLSCSEIHSAPEFLPPP